MNDSEELGECPICGHVAVILVDKYSQEKTILCPDKYCANNHDKPETQKELLI
jgi:transcription elongation factor Elf1